MGLVFIQCDDYDILIVQLQIFWGINVEKYKREETSILALKYTFLVQNRLKLKLLDVTVKGTRLKD